VGRWKTSTAQLVTTAVQAGAPSRHHAGAARSRCRL
jgi:hypothetical protein